MKKAIVVLICVFFAIIILLYTYYQSSVASVKSVNRFNLEYEKYFEKDFYGADVVTLINKAIDNNEQYSISKNSNGKYESDEKYCLKIIIKFKDVKTLYEMEDLNKAGLEGFIKNFNSSIFKITDYEYNKYTNRIGRIVIEEVQIGNI